MNKSSQSFISTILNLFAVAIPITHGFQIFVGVRIYFSEFFVALTFLTIFLTPSLRNNCLNHIRGNTFFLNSIKLIFLWFICIIVSDLINESSLFDSFRGILNCLFFAIDLTVVFFLFSVNFRLAILSFLIGISIARILSLFLHFGSPEVGVFQGEGFDEYIWKFGIGQATNNISFLFLIFFEGFPIRSTLAFLSIIGFVVNARSQGLFTFLNIFISSLKIEPFLKILRLNLIVSLILSIFFISFLGDIYIEMSKSGALGERAEQKNNMQAKNVDNIFEFLLAGRSEIFASSSAIADSPILGHGSWARDTTGKYSYQRYLSLLDYTDNARFREEDIDLIPAHSYITSTWVYAGMFASIFWFYIIFILLRFQYVFIKRQLDLSWLGINNTSLVFIANDMWIRLFWNIFFSPFSGGHRLTASYDIVFLIILFNVITNYQYFVDDLNENINYSITNTISN